MLLLKCHFFSVCGTKSVYHPFYSTVKYICKSSVSTLKKKKNPNLLLYCSTMLGSFLLLAKQMVLHCLRSSRVCVYVSLTLNLALENYTVANFRPCFFLVDRYKTACLFCVKESGVLFIINSYSIIVYHGTSLKYITKHTPRTQTDRTKLLYWS